MAGLLDWMATPQGQGLLSGIASYAMNARRGTPVNNLGRGLAGGVAGYVNANDQLRQDEEDKYLKEYRTLQMDQLRQDMERKKALRDASVNAGKLASTPTQYAVGGQTFGTPQQAQASAENMYTLPAGAVPDDLLPSTQPRTPGFMGSTPTGAVDFSGGQAPQVTEQKSQDMRTALYTQLMQAGLPDEAMKYAPKWTVGERFNEQTGMREKVIYDENNPTVSHPFGGAEADTIVADNLGGSMVYRGAHSAKPVGEVQRTASPDAVMSRDTTIRGQNLVDARAREANAQGGKAPAGYRFRPDGSLEAIPGGPADIKAGELGAKDAARKEFALAQSQNVLDAIKDAKGLVGLRSAGFAGTLRNMPMTAARDLDAKLTTIKANLGFDRLQQMRDTSPTGGALGQVAVQELTALQATVASLDQLQSPAELRKALGKIETHYTNWQKTLKGETPNSTPKNATGTFKDPYNVTSDADFESVPKGKYFKAPDGTTRVKP